MSTIEIGSRVVFTGEWTEDLTKEHGFNLESQEVGITSQKGIDFEGDFWSVHFTPVVKKVKGHRGGKLTRKVEISRILMIPERLLRLV